ncbi:unnamed protein product [Diabrotica balteata]|uniref:Uncharacterized protein n=1 Tax=Diabrotica balteata TaxID=107213 RepID=A0A9N9T5C2_DIABA|nr:unnamed protein product [Diabrotica balteata]
MQAMVEAKVFTQTDLIFNVVQNQLTDIIHSKNRIKKLLQNHSCYFTRAPSPNIAGSSELSKIGKNNSIIKDKENLSIKTFNHFSTVSPAPETFSSQSKQKSKVTQKKHSQISTSTPIMTELKNLVLKKSLKTIPPKNTKTRKSNNTKLFHKREVFVDSSDSNEEVDPVCDDEDAVKEFIMERVARNNNEICLICQEFDINIECIMKFSCMYCVMVLIWLKTIFISGHHNTVIPAAFM